MGLQQREHVGVAQAFHHHQRRWKPALELARSSGASVYFEHRGHRHRTTFARAPNAHGWSVRESSRVQNGLIIHRLILHPLLRLGKATSARGLPGADARAPRTASGEQWLWRPPLPDALVPPIVPGLHASAIAATTSPRHHRCREFRPRARAVFAWTVRRRMGL